jgi:hypothetical protein
MARPLHRLRFIRTPRRVAYVHTRSAIYARSAGGRFAWPSAVLADRSLFRALPYRDGDRLVSVGVIAPLLNQQPFALAGMYRDWRSQRDAMRRARLPRSDAERRDTDRETQKRSGLLANR